MRSWKPLLVLAIVAIALFLERRARMPHPPAPPSVSAVSVDVGSDAALPSFLPPAARDTLALIARGGPFPHRQDGVVFGNYEHRLPERPRGYYHEYTVDTPGARTRGTRRIITGGTPPEVYYYTGDHYRSFRRFAVPR
ncbi:MAG: ribonuclease [Xanthomonadaceae bacterium]|nr:ribonuclease [Xanthomonadaceae bacterium]